MKNISLKLSHRVLKGEKNAEEKEKLLAYSFELAFDRLLLFFYIITLALLTHTLLSSLITFTFMTLFRNLFQGFHFKKFIYCLFFSIFLFTLAVTSSTFLKPELLLPISIILSVLCIFLLLFKTHKQKSTKFFLILFLVINLIYANTSLYFQHIFYLICISLFYSLIMHLISDIKIISQHK